MKFEWSSKLETGIEKVDTQHKQLIEKVNHLLESCKRGKGKEEVNNTINFLADYVVKHFSDEEKYMEKYNYPEYMEHKKIHDNFINDFKELIKEKESTSFVTKLQIRVADWLITHINVVDKKMAKFLKDKIQ